MSDNKPDALAAFSACGRKLLQKAHDPIDTHRSFGYWVRDVAKWLDEQYPDSGMSAEWSSLSTSPLVSAGQYWDQPEHWEQFRQAVQRRLCWLRQIAVNKATQPATALNATGARKVFVVHGHNEACRNKVARFLEKLNLAPIILHEQPNKGRTIIEKFNDYSEDVAYAVVLLTGDDIGGVKGKRAKSQLPRARQNVIFELGYFLSKLGRDHVCILHESGVEVPSDYSGVLYLPLDTNDAWRLELARELNTVGLPADMNNAV